MRKTIGVVADDTTGANDIGVMFNRGGYTAKIETFDQDAELQVDTNVVIVDTDSRLDSLEDSYNKVYIATKQLMAAGCSTFHNKTCSVFRGNIGTEFDAMLDALGEEFAVVSLAFPENGRQTEHGIHTVDGKLLEESGFLHDPVHPTTDSNLVRVLSEQTERKVTFVDLEFVRQGAAVLQEKILEKRKEGYSYCIVDSKTQEDLRIVAEAISNFKVICGSSAIGLELPPFYGEEPIELNSKQFSADPNQGVLVISGSLTLQTKEQTAYLEKQGEPTFTLDSREILTAYENASKEIKRIVSEVSAYITNGNNVLVLADNTPEVVKETKELGHKAGLHPLEISKRISAALADIAKEVCDQTDLKRLVVAGGDTSGTVTRKLGIKGNYILEEIDTGVPSGLSMGREMLIVLKSGSFGKKDFLVKAIEHLKSIENI
ncbi:four-carbon acid sugar kinase family protein [Terribacillus aidingensis]|uniref:four-carbon acid sugar kinase family protein n=1 Tax=Terribacillus aidingensis TaxID=586416 RepID=UPI0034509EDF